MKYELKEGKFIKNGHTMFEQDVLKDLERLAYLETQQKDLPNDKDIRKKGVEMVGEDYWLLTAFRQGADWMKEQTNKK